MFPCWSCMCGLNVFNVFPVFHPATTEGTVSRDSPVLAGGNATILHLFLNSNHCV